MSAGGLRPGTVFVISSPSGGGKTTVARRVRRQVPRLRRSVSVTTRSPRPGERQDRDYRFVSREEFVRLRRRGELLEWARVHGAWYGTPKRPILEALARGEEVLLCIDVQGAKQVRRALGRRAVLVFLMPPSMERLRERLTRRRTDTASAIRNRLLAARRELACAAWYDYTVVNDELNAAIRDVCAIVVARARGGLSKRVRRRAGEQKR